MNKVTLSESDINRYWKYVKRSGEDDCWLWTGARWGNPNLTNDLYGRLGVMVGKEGNRKQIGVRAHRIAFLLAHGRWPNGVVRHICDNPLCVNPQHLAEGSLKNNTRDMMERGRGGGQFKSGHKGIKGNVKINREIADKIRSEYVNHGVRTGGGTLRENSLAGLAKKYGVSKHTVLQVVKGRTWNDK